MKKMRSALGELNFRKINWRGKMSRSPYNSSPTRHGLPSPPRPERPISKDRNAFCSDSLKVRPMAMASPTLFICVFNVESAWGNFSKAKRGTLVTT